MRHSILRTFGFAWLLLLSVPIAQGAEVVAAVAANFAAAMTRTLSNRIGTNAAKSKQNHRQILGREGGIIPGQGANPAQQAGAAACPSPNFHRGNDGKCGQHAGNKEGIR